MEFQVLGRTEASHFNFHGETTLTKAVNEVHQACWWEIDRGCGLDLRLVELMSLCLFAALLDSNRMSVSHVSESKTDRNKQTNHANININSLSEVNQIRPIKYSLICSRF